MKQTKSLYYQRRMAEIALQGSSKTGPSVARVVDTIGRRQPARRTARRVFNVAWKPSALGGYILAHDLDRHLTYWPRADAEMVARQLMGVSQGHRARLVRIGHGKWRVFHPDSELWNP